MAAALGSAALLADLAAGLERAAAARRRTLVSATVAVEVTDPVAARLRLAPGQRSLVLPGAAGPRLRAGRPRQAPTRRCRAGRTASATSPASASTLARDADRRRRGGPAAGRRAGLERRLRLRRRRRDVADLVLVPARPPGPARDLAVPLGAGETFATLNAVGGGGTDRDEVALAARRAPGVAARRPAAAARSRPDRADGDRERPPARAISRPRWRPRSSGSAPARSRRSCWPARSWCARPPPTTPPPCSARCGSCSRPASASAAERRRRPSSAPAPSPGPPLGRRRRDRRARRLDAAQLRPGGRRPPRPAAAAQRQGPPEHEIVVRRIVRRLAPAFGLGRAGARSGPGQDRQHPAPGDPDPRPARGAALGGRAGRAAASDPGDRWRALAGRRDG